MNAEVGCGRSCLDPHRQLSQEAAQTSARLNPPTDLGRALLRAVQRLQIQHTARRRGPSSPHQLKQCTGKSVFSVSASRLFFFFFKKQCMNSKDFKGPAFQNLDHPLPEQAHEGAGNASPPQFHRHLASPSDHRHER